MVKGPAGATATVAGTPPRTLTLNLISIPRPTIVRTTSTPFESVFSCPVIRLTRIALITLITLCAISTVSAISTSRTHRACFTLRTRRALRSSRTLRTSRTSRASGTGRARRTCRTCLTLASHQGQTEGQYSNYEVMHCVLPLMETLLIRNDKNYDTRLYRLLSRIWID